MIKILLLIMSLLSCKTQARSIELNPKRTVVVKGVIDGRAIGTASLIEKLADGSGQPIYLVINSPGGSVIAGAQIISAMNLAKARGHKFICLVPMLAASMGFQIFVHCDQRYALENSLLLFHPMSVELNGSQDSEHLLYYSLRLRAWEKPFIRDLMNTLKINADVFLYHYRNQTMWFASEFGELSPKFVKIVEDVRGFSGLFDL